MSSKRTTYDHCQHAKLFDKIIGDTSAVIKSQPQPHELDFVINLYRNKLFSCPLILSTIMKAAKKYSPEILYLLKNINMPCLIINKTDKQLLTELEMCGVLGTITLDYYSSKSIAELIWDKDIIDACTKYDEDFYSQLSYYKKGVERDSNFVSWCLDVIDKAPHIKIRLSRDHIVVKKVGKIIRKETVNYKSDVLKEYYFYKVLKVNRNSIKDLSYRQIHLSNGDILHYTTIDMKKYRVIKAITTNNDNPNLKFGVINDKLLIKYVLKRLQSLFNRSIIHCDIKLSNILISKRTKNKCIIIDYEHSFDMKDKYFQQQNRRHLVSTDGDVLSYKIYHGQMLDELIYSYKADIVNLIYTVVVNLCGMDIDEEMSVLDKVLTCNKYIRENKFYTDLIDTLDSEDTISNHTYNRLIEIANYYLLTH